MGGFAQLPIDLVGKVSNNALIVYTMMRDRAEYDTYQKVWLMRYKATTIAKMCNISLRCCHSCLAELEQACLLEHDRTGRSSYYMINPPSALRQPEGENKVTITISKKGAIVNE